MGRTARGVRGINPAAGHKLISLIVPKADGRILTVTENGYGKRTENAEFPQRSRRKGVIAMSTSARNVL